MEAKDYLKYYIGQECKVYEDDSMDKFGYDTLKGIISNTQAAFENYQCSIRLVVPILRPLSSMTEEEVKEVYAIKRQYPGKTKNSEFEYSSANPIIFHYLLSRGFDLFGGIEAKWAVEKVNESV